MKWTKMFSASCLAAALATTTTFGQDQPVEVRVRAIAGPDGKVLQVLEERVLGKDDEKAEKKEEGKTDGQPLRARIFRRAQELGEKIAEAAEGATVEIANEDFWGEMPQSDYWIGVQIAPVSAEVRKHIPVKHGVLVQQVYPDSPAIKAELQADDILLQAGDAKIETGPDLVKAIDAAKTTEVPFLVLRGGKEIKLKITPTKRENENERLPVLTAPAVRLERLHAAQKQFEKALETLRAETQPEQGKVDLMLVRPGAFIMQSDVAKLPDDVTVQITKEGNKPAKIQVKKGDKSWDATSDKLDALPKELRPAIEQMLHGNGPPFVTTFTNPYMNVTPHTARVQIPGGNGPTVTTIAPSATVPYGVAPVPALPTVPGMPATPPVVAKAATAWAHAIGPNNSDAKLDQILKKLDSLASPDLEAMKAELKALRKEVDELRKKADK
ncbi:PDZ domain-containing protein [Anatilimnocola floriformis]|uniref:PDZ domain-containing protein n=1 Tax=Anatilimnocola floriformis TaxID=2948575 RepID=UPI0020C39C83|nr:PDZ domain-containing protein [Anatilimnocola floriformis]